jgi:hypothetical protein
VRIKHRLGANPIKLYDKAYDELGAVLRPEITITDTLLFRVFGRRTGSPIPRRSGAPCAADWPICSVARKCRRKLWTATVTLWPGG